MARRRFVDPLIRCCILTLGLWQVALASLSKNSYIQSFSLADVDLAEHSDFAEGEALNHAYLLQLDVDNLLYNFR